MAVQIHCDRLLLSFFILFSVDFFMSHNCVINTNGLEATSKVVKEDLTCTQRIPVLDFLQKSLRRSSERDDSTVLVT